MLASQNRPSSTRWAHTCQANKYRDAGPEDLHAHLFIAPKASSLLTDAMIPVMIIHMHGAHPPLFEVYPHLANTVAHLDLGIFPTPVQQISHLGHPNLWIKRDDLSSDLYGGNKVRKLEFVLAEAMRNGRKRVVTMGGIGTNHGLATAVFCDKLALDCTLLLFPQPVTRHVRQNLLLFQRFRAELRYYRSILQTGLAFYTIERLRHPTAYYLYAGGSSPLGTLGFVNAAFELQRQIAAGEMPRPDYIFCPLGSNGTAAGLALGIALAGIDTTLCPVRVTASHLGPFPMATQGTVLTLMRQTLQLLARHNPHLVPPALHAPHVFDAYFGRAYGDPTREGLAALNLLKEKEDIRLDPTYTSKTFAAVLDFIAQPANKDKTILYWHTYNSVDLSHHFTGLNYHTLPDRFHPFFEGEPLPLA